MKVAIVGAGVFGLSAALSLHARRHQVTIFEQGKIPHPQASGTDISKAIRLEYGRACALYTPLAEEAWDLWHRIEEETGVSFLHRTGIYMLASRFQTGSHEWESHAYLSQRGHKIEVMDRAEGAERFPQFGYGGIEAALYNPWGGYVEAAVAVSTLAGLARDRGVRLVEGVRTEGLAEDGSWVEIQEARFDRALVAAGPWVARLLPELAEEIRVSRQQLTFFRPLNSEAFREDGFPVWTYDLAEEGWYGFPITDDGVLKISNHSHGVEVDPDVGRDVGADFVEESKAFVRRALPSLDPETYDSGKSCLYTNSSDGHFILDRAPGFDRVFLAGVGSGHGFKFGPVIGRMAADLIEGGEVPHPFRLEGRVSGRVV